MNLDKIVESNEELVEAIKNGDTKGFIDKLSNRLNESVEDAVQNEVMQKYEALKDENDSVILASRGITALTSEEKSFYSTLIDNSKNE